MKKKMIFVIPTMRMGGAEKSLVSLLKTIDSDMFEVDLFLFESGGALQSEIPQWVNVIGADKLTRSMLLEWRLYAKELIKGGYIREFFVRTWISIKTKMSRRRIFEWSMIEKYIPMIESEYDVAIGYLEGNTDFFVLDKIKAKKKLGWIHIDYTGRNLLKEEIQYYSKFDKLVTISEVCKNAFTAFLPEASEKMDIIENIVIKEDVLQKSEEPISEKDFDSSITNIVSVGRLDMQKGFDIAARVAKKMVERNIDFCWHIYGEGVMREELERYIEVNGLDTCFVLEGIKKNPYPYMKRADIIVQPSRYEGKSIVLDEAKILGKAIVVTNYASVFDQIKAGETGIITEMFPEAIADGIQMLIENEKLRRKLEINASLEENNSRNMKELFYKIIA